LGIPLRGLIVRAGGTRNGGYEVQTLKWVRIARRYLLISLLVAPMPIIQRSPQALGCLRSQNSSQFQIKVFVGLVVLHATTQDRRGVAVSGLEKDDFQVFEDGVQQRIEVFSHEDIPVTVGLIVDSSGSMKPKRAAVITAATTFARASNPKDQMFVVNFNERVSFGLPEGTSFTDQVAPLELALARAPATGKTALYDAISAGLNHLKKGDKDKKVLIVISDGGDNASTSKLKDVMTRAVESNAVIYTIGIFDETDNDRNPQVLKELARATGGEAYIPDSLEKLVPVCERIAHDIRNQYTIAYASTNATQDGAYRAIQVKANAPGHGRLVVRTRAGYYAPTKSAQTSPLSRVPGAPPAKGSSAGRQP
jgi:Ca-activated chloride channel family protein